MQDTKFAELSKITQNHPANNFEVRLDSKERFARGTYHLHTFHLEDHLIGGSRLFVKEDEKNIYRSAFYPLKHLIGGQRKGIGTLAHLGTYKALDLQNKEDYFVVQDAVAEDLGHVAAMGVDVKDVFLGKNIRKRFPYNEYVAQIDAYARNKGYLRPGEKLNIKT